MAELVLSLVTLAISVGSLVFVRRVGRTWRKAAEGWELRARAAEDVLRALPLGPLYPERPDGLPATERWLNGHQQVWTGTHWTDPSRL